MSQKVLITGASGFIGKNLCKKISRLHRVVGVDSLSGDEKDVAERYPVVRADITDSYQMRQLCERFQPDIIIHCAGIAHQRFSSGIKAEDYYSVNMNATLSLAEIAIDNNPDIYFIFLSSISVYGEEGNNQKKTETSVCQPSTPYAGSKFGAENGLVMMWDRRSLNKLDILRLSPVYSKDWVLNFEKRVFGPLKMCYVRFGSGDQRMSALALPNLIGFILYRIENQALENRWCQIFNVTDKQDYSFNEIIKVFKTSPYLPNRLTIRIPLALIMLGAKMLSKLFTKREKWFLSCHDKLANSLVFDNSRMLETGFLPKYNLENTFVER